MIKVKKVLMLVTLTVILLFLIGFFTTSFANETDKQPAKITLKKQSEPEQPFPFIGSRVILRNAATTLSFDKSKELTYNPFYEASITFMPRFQVSNWYSIAAQFSLSKELTNSDYTTYKNETIVSDLSLIQSFTNILKIPVLDINTSLSLSLTLPMSKVSTARTLIMAVGPGLTLSRNFEILSGISISNTVRGIYFWHEYTTGNYDGCPIISVADTECDEYNNIGVRNPEFRILNTTALSISLLSSLAISSSFIVINDPLHDSYTDESISLTVQEPTNMRFTNSFNAALSYSPFKNLGFELGMNTTNQQLSTDGKTYYSPLYNRFTVAYFDLILSI